MKIKVPQGCLYCNAPWSGGHELPLKEMKKGLRVFYKCGASLSIKEQTENSCLLLFKNCTVQEDKSGVTNENKKLS